MGDRRKPGTVMISLRMQQEDKERIEAAVKKLNELTPGANYTVQSLIRASVMARVAEIEEQ